MDYEAAKRVFYDKLTGDLIGMHRMESAFYWTAKWIYDQGCKEADAKLQARINELEAQLSTMTGERNDQGTV